MVNFIFIKTLIFFAHLPGLTFSGAQGDATGGGGGKFYLLSGNLSAELFLLPSGKVALFFITSRQRICISEKFVSYDCVSFSCFRSEKCSGLGSFCNLFSSFPFGVCFILNYYLNAQTESISYVFCV